MTLREAIVLENQEILTEDKRSIVASLAAIILGVTAGLTGSATKMDNWQQKIKPQIGIERVIEEFGLNAIVNFLSLIGSGASIGMAIQAYAAGKARNKIKKLEKNNEKTNADNTNLKNDIINLEKKIAILTSNEKITDNAKATIKTLNNEINRLYIKYPEEQFEGIKFSQQTQSGVRSFLNKLRGKK
jgi:cell division protein FtsB